MTAAYDIRMTLLANGYTPLACDRETKRPVITGWPDIVVSPEHIASWDLQFPKAQNHGLRLEAFDLDISDEEICQDLESEIRDWFDGRGEILVRFGNPPRRLIPISIIGELTKVSRIFKDVAGKQQTLELLGTRSQFLAYGTHPKGYAYTWFSDRGPCNVPSTNLPQVTAAEAGQLFEHLSNLLTQRHSYTVITDDPPARANGHDKAAGCFDADEALATMQPTGASVEDTQRRVILSRLQHGTHPDDILEEIVDITMRVANSANLGWSRDVEITEVKSRIIKQFATACRDCDRAPPSWLPPEFYEKAQGVLSNGRKLSLGYNRGGWYLRSQQQSQADQPDGNEFDSGAEQQLAPEQPVKKYKFPLLRFGAMRPGTEPNYLVDELIPVAGLVVVYGAPKSGKSFWVLDLMLHVALAWEYRERAVQQGTVIYCAFEGAHGYRKRCEAFRRHHMLIDEDPPLYVVPGRADLIKDHTALIKDMRAQLAEEVTTVRCVVLDTLNKSLIGSESKDVDMANYIAAAEAIQAAFSCVVIIVHHHGIDETRPRGHTSLRGAVDAQIKITRDERNNIIAEIEDMRDGPEGTQLMSRLVVVDVGADNAGRPLTSAAVEAIDLDHRSDGRKMPKLTANQKTMFSILDAAPTGLTTDEWNDQAREAGLGTKRRADLHDLRDALKARGLVCLNNKRWFVTPKFKSGLD